MKVNPNEAPEGYFAIKGDNCDLCAFNSITLTCYRANCLPVNRHDTCNVIFIKNLPIYAQHADSSNFQNELIKSIADDCGFIINNMNMQENIKEVEFFASKVFEAGVEFGKQQVNKEIH